MAKKRPDDPRTEKEEKDPTIPDPEDRQDLDEQEQPLHHEEPAHERKKTDEEAESEGKEEKSRYGKA